VFKELDSPDRLYLKINAIIDFVFEDNFRGANRKWSVKDARTLVA
jgi:hypothetical protein